MIKKAKRIDMIFSITLFVVIFFSACMPAFEDETQSIVMKPELISIVLEPPEARPGDEVTASFLMADAMGVYKPVIQVWMLNTAENSSFAAEGVNRDTTGKETTDLSGLDPETTSIFPAFTFKVPEDSQYSYNELGLAPQMLSFVAATEMIDMSAASDPKAGLAMLQELVATGKAKAGIRTLVVSKRENPNKNPMIKSITARFGRTSQDAKKTEVVFASSSDENLEEARLNAAKNPYIYSLSKGGELNFIAEVSDDGTKEEQEEAIRYQWISTGGDFQNRRQKEQPWTVPFYIHPFGEYKDMSMSEKPDHRKDPNLYPIWLIVRDTGKDNQLGQSFAEFYVRVIL